MFNQLKAIVGEKNVILDREKMIDYTHDELFPRERNVFPAVVVKPNSTAQVAALMKLATQGNWPVVVRGGGTGLCGGCLPCPDGILLSLERMKKIKVDEENLTVEAEAGVSLRELYNLVEGKNFFFPPRPGDENATVGGVVATNAGGARAVKYGVVRNFVRGIEVVLPSGQISFLGGKLVKNSTGYNLLQLLIGSEGTLAVITKVIFTILPPIPYRLTLIVPFVSLKRALEAVFALLKSGSLPLAVEFLEKDVLLMAKTLMDKNWPSLAGEADLMIMLDGKNEEELFKTAEEIERICLSYGAIEVFVAEDKRKQEEILEIRSHLYELLKPHLVEEMDISLPPAELTAHLEQIHFLEEKLKIWLPTYGHAADGNLHTHLMKSEFKDGKWQEIPDWQKKNQEAKSFLLEDAKKRGGVISGEHGIGLVRKKYLPLFLDQAQLDLMRKIKKVFDPQNILNPEKVI
jgi:glycolate oxidase